MEIINYIMDNALIVIPALWIIGKVIKEIPNIPNWIIPFALLIVGVPASMALVGWTVDGAIQGILVTGVAVYGNQIIKQIGEATKDADD